MFTSEISSSPRVISCAVGPAVAAGAPLTIDKDNPAAPNNGTAHARLFCFDAFFARDMLESSHTFGALKDRLSGEMRRGKAYPSVAVNVKYRQSFHAAWSSPTASGQGEERRPKPMRNGLAYRSEAAPPKGTPSGAVSFDATWTFFV